MKTACCLIASLILFSAWAFAETHVTRSTPAECAWTYDPGKPTLERQDTVNPTGIMLRWQDNDNVVCRKAVQPVRTFNVVVPPGLTPRLTIESVHSVGQLRGLPGKPVGAIPQTETPSKVWAQIVSVENWHGFRLARVDVYLQIGDMQRSEMLTEISLRVSFVGSPGITAETSKDAALLGKIALNGRIAGTWWQIRPRTIKSVVSTQGIQAVWPALDMQRLVVTETGLYQITGSSLIGASLIGQQISRIKLFGNGGKLLALRTETAIDSSLQEDAILIEDHNNNGTFDREDRLLFYGHGLKGADYCDSSDNDELRNRAHQSPYSTENIYFLAVDPSGSSGKRMDSLRTSGSGAIPVSTSRARAYLDQDVFIFGSSDEQYSGLTWYMATLGPSNSRAYPINLDGATGATVDTLVIGMRAIPQGYSGFRIYVGDSLVSSRYIGGYDPYFTTIPRGVLVPGNNVIRLENNSPATIYLNYIEVRYERSVSTAGASMQFSAPPRQTGLFSYSLQGFDPEGYVLDVTNPLEPRLAVGTSFVDSSFTNAQHRYFAVRSNQIGTPQSRGIKPGHPTGLDYISLRDTTNQADMIILTYDEGYDLLDSLKRLHETYRYDSMNVMRVRLTDVYDEFGWGVHDVMAIRNFLKYTAEEWRGPAPNYVLFVGGGNYDYRNIEGAGSGLFPPFEYYLDCRDDYYVMFNNFPRGNPSMHIGRWPVTGNGELQNVVSKTVAYVAHPLYGSWKNTATFAADDEYKGGCDTFFETTHVIQAEALINSVLPQYFTFKKVYEILYPARNSSVGTVKPDATRDLIESINNGTLVVNFTGHGNPTVWTDELLFVMDRDKPLLHNGRRWPFFMAATCSWGQYDRTVGRCFPDALLVDPSDGSIMSVAATRYTYAGENQALMIDFYNDVFTPGLVKRRTFGEAMTVTKLNHPGGTEYYHLIGDPALRLATPEFFARVSPSSDDTLQALSLFHLDGEVSRDSAGAVWTGFRGVVDARVYDTQDSAAYYWCGNTSSTPFYYGLPGNAIFRGTATVDSGRFHVTFRVPRDVRFGGNNAKISLYFDGFDPTLGPDSADGIGIEQHIPIANHPSTERDSIPPSIGAWLEAPSFRSGDLVSGSPRLHVTITDDSGINLSGAVGHKITGRVDESEPEDLTPYFNYDLDKHTTGNLEKVIGPLAAGEHRLLIEAWDSFNNLNQFALTFRVGEGGSAGYAIKDVYNFPNPMKDVTYFTYTLTSDGTRRVHVKIFTLTGKLVYELDNLGTAPLFNSNSQRPWDGRDREGHLLGNGVYFYRVKAEDNSGHSAEATGKLVILR